MFDPRMLLAAALMLAGAVVAVGAWLVRGRGPRTALVVGGTLVFAGGVVALIGVLE